jgi:hypothetical protein
MVLSVSSIILSARWQTQQERAVGEAGGRTGSVEREERRGTGTCTVCVGADMSVVDDGEHGEHGGLRSDANSEIGNSGIGGK